MQVTKIDGIIEAELRPKRQAHFGRHVRIAREFAERIAASALTSGQKVTDTVAAFTDEGCDELILFPCNPDLAQVSLIAEAAGL